METKKPYKRYLLYSFFALFLLSGFSAHGTEPGLGGVESRRPLFLPAPDENEGADTREVQALKDGYEIVAYEEVLLGDTGKPGLGGVESSYPLFLPAPDENEGADTREVQALKDGYKIVAYEEVLLGDTGKPGLGGVESRYPLFLLAPDQSESYDTKTIRK